MHTNLLILPVDKLEGSIKNNNKPNSLPSNSNSCKETLFLEYRVVDTLTSNLGKNPNPEYENPVRNYLF